VCVCVCVLYAYIYIYVLNTNLYCWPIATAASVYSERRGRLGSGERGCVGGREAERGERETQKVGGALYDAYGAALYDGSYDESYDDYGLFLISLLCCSLFCLALSRPSCPPLSSFLSLSLSLSLYRSLSLALALARSPPLLFPLSLSLSLSLFLSLSLSLSCALSLSQNIGIEIDQGQWYIPVAASQKAGTHKPLY
jgi:hypothetical protein